MQQYQEQQHARTQEILAYTQAAQQQSAQRMQALLQQYQTPSPTASLFSQYQQQQYAPPPAPPPDYSSLYNSIASGFQPSAAVPAAPTTDWSQILSQTDGVDIIGNFASQAGQQLMVAGASACSIM
ncbi:hypothetical protein BT69DRAFT_1277239 [Atractiella rhizophila]|nr:hypothetical protein BT69DRAFT_1277239 [Atractiella rhizophila]